MHNEEKKVIWRGYDPWFGVEIRKMAEGYTNDSRVVISSINMGMRKEKNLYIPNSSLSPAIGLSENEQINGINVVKNINADGLSIPKNSICFLYSVDNLPLIIFFGYEGGERHHSRVKIFYGLNNQLLKLKDNTSDYEVTILGKGKNIKKELEFCGVEKIIMPPMDISDRGVLIAHRK